MYRTYRLYATITIPAGTTVIRNHDHSPTRFDWPLTVRAHVMTTATGNPKGAMPIWFFMDGNTQYYVKMQPTVTYTAETLKRTGVR